MQLFYIQSQVGTLPPCLGEWRSTWFSAFDKTLQTIVIVLRPWHTQGLWKISKKPNPIVKFGCGSVRKFAYFVSQNRISTFKNQEKYKKKKITKNPTKVKKKLVLLFDIYFFQILLLTFKFSKIYFSEFCPILKKSVRHGHPTRMGLPWKN